MNSNDDTLVPQMRVLGFVLFCIIAIPSLVFSDTQPFWPDNGWTTDGPFYAGLSSQVADAVFQNPSYMGGVKKSQIAVYGTSASWGYGSFKLGAVYPLSFATIGVGYSVFSSLDNVATQRSSLTNRIESGGTFEHSFRHLSISGAVPLPHKWCVSMSIDYLSQVLQSQQATVFGADFGCVWRPDEHYWIGIATKQLLQTSLVWSGSQVQERSPTQYVLEAGLSVPLGWVSATYDGSYTRLAGGWYVHTMCLINADIIQSDSQLMRCAIGTQLDCGSFLLAYRKKIGLQQDLAMDQDQLGVVFRL